MLNPQNRTGCTPCTCHPEQGKPRHGRSFHRYRCPHHTDSGACSTVDWWFCRNRERHLDEWYKNAYVFSPFTEVFNLTGQPAISVPVGIMANGLSIGMQIVGRFGDE